MTDPLRDALNGVVTKSTWRPDNTVLIHDGTAWNTLVGRIVMATNGEREAQAVTPTLVPVMSSHSHITSDCHACRELVAAALDALAVEVERLVQHWSADVDDELPTGKNALVLRAAVLAAIDKARPIMDTFDAAVLAIVRGEQP